MHTKFWSQNLKRPLRRPLHRWEDNIRMDPRKMWEGVEWMHLAQDRDQWHKHSNELLGSIKGGEFLD
jgi:hypothetical protein